MEIVAPSCSVGIAIITKVHREQSVARSNGRRGLCRRVSLPQKSGAGNDVPSPVSIGSRS